MPERGASRTQTRAQEEKMSTVRPDSVVRLIDRPASSEGLRRVELVPSPTAPTRHLGVGLVWTPHGGGSPAAHHHGEAETAVYVLEGQAGFYCGGGLRERAEGGPGAFIFIPPNVVHQEYNPGHVAHTVVVARDVHGSSWFAAEAPETTPVGGTGVCVGDEGIGPTAGRARRLALAIRALAPAERTVIDPAGRETVVAVLDGEPSFISEGAEALTAGAGNWVYVPPDADCAVVNPHGSARATLLVLHGPVIDAPAPPA
jgi:uncharacterized RmlC-like cupin family protein